MSNAADRLTAWIIERSASEPTPVRSQILRDAADTIAGSAAAQRMIQLADEIEHSARLQADLLLDFGRLAKAEQDHAEGGK